SDPDRLSQVFANLIKNSVDFVPKSDGVIEINAHGENNQVVFYVKDNGSGIPKEKQENLFKKFYQIDTSLKRSHGGTGLGLVICKGIAEALGGKIWFESEIGKGATFYFTIPKMRVDYIKT
ncbi:MAG: ATP-binding protein, partial [Thaumarchaeota archaeon]|nr:ATP-binding protein [Nitrososphaerota archaeon]